MNRKTLAQEISIDELGLSKRILRILKNKTGRFKIKNVKDLTEITEIEIMKTYGFGKKSLSELKLKLKEKGFSIGESAYLGFQIETDNVKEWIEIENNLTKKGIYKLVRGGVSSSKAQALVYLAYLGAKDSIFNENKKLTQK